MAILFDSVVAQFSNSNVSSLASGSVAGLFPAGRRGFVGVTLNSRTVNVTSISDTQGNTYVKLVERLHATANLKEELWYVANTVGGANNNITVTLSGSVGVGNDAGLKAVSASGVAAIGSFNSAEGSGNTASVTSPTHDANDFYLASIGHLATGSSSAGSGTILVSDANISISQYMVDNTSATAGNVTTSVNNSVGASFVALAVELRDTAASPIRYRLLDSFVGAAAVLPTSPWQQQNLDSITLNRNGSGSVVASGINTNDTMAYRNDQAFGADQWSRAKIGGTYVSQTNYAEVGVRLAGTTAATAKGYTLFTDTVAGGGAGHCGFALYFNSGVSVVLASLAVTYSVGDEMMLWMRGTVLYAYKNGVQVGSYDTVGDTNKVTSGGAPGLGVSNYGATPTALLSNWEGGDTEVVYLRSAKNSQGTPTGSLAITANLAAGETAVLFWGQNGGTLGSISSISGGGSWSQIGANFAFSTSIGRGQTYGLLSASAAATVTVNYSGTPDSVAGLIDIYAGVTGFGSNTQSSNTSSTTPSVSLTTTTVNSVVAAGLFWDDGTVPTPAASVGVKRDSVLVVSNSDNHIIGYDNFVANPSSVANTSVAFAASGSWGATAVELQSVAGGLKVLLKQGTTVIATRDVPVTTNFATYAFDLTSGERAAITSWSDLRLAFQSGDAASDYQVSQAWLRTPVAGATTVTKTVAATGVLRKTVTKSVTVSSTQQRLGITKTVAASAVLLKTVSKLVTVSATLRKTVTKTVAATATVLKQGITKSVTASADVQRQGITKSVTVSAWLSKVFTKAVTVSAVLQKTVTKLVTASATLQKTVTKSVAASATLRATVPKQVTVSAVLQKTATKSVAVSATLWKTVTKAVAATVTMLKQGITKTVTAGAIVQRQGITKTVTLNAVITRPVIKSVTASAVLRKTIAKSVAVDVTLKAFGVTRSVAVDALKSQKHTLAVTLSAITTRPVLKTVAVSAVLLKTVTKTVAATATIKALGVVRTVAASSTIQRQGVTKTVSASAVLQKTVAKVVTVTGFKVLRIQKTVSSSAVLRATVAKVVSVSGFLSQAGKLSVVVSATLLKQGITKSVTANAIITRPVTKSVTVSAILRATVSKSFSASSTILRQGATKSVAASSIVQRQGISKSVSVSGVVRQTVLRQVAVSATLRKTVLETVSASAVLQKTVAKTMGASATLRRTVLKVVTLSGVARKTVLRTITVSAVLSKTRTMPVTVSSWIVLVGKKTVAASATLKANVKKTVVAQAVIQTTVHLSTEVSAVFRRLGSDSWGIKSSSIEPVIEIVCGSPVAAIEVSMDALAADIEVSFELLLMDT
jgi:hypothetical protein